MQSCTSGHNVVFTGMYPLRTGLIPPELPGSPAYLRPGTSAPRRLALHPDRRVLCGALLSLAVLFWCYMIPYSVTVGSAAAPEASLSFLFWGAGVFVLPVIALYTGVVYGIAAAELTKVFQAFHRADANRADGLGLGLFIAKRAAQLLGHRFEVRSAPGRGSCFVVVANAVFRDPRDAFLDGAT